MALLGLQQLRTLFVEPQILHKWEVFIPAYPNAAVPDMKDMSFFIETIPLPANTTGGAGGAATIDVTLGGFNMHYNGKSSRRGSMNFTINENRNAVVTKYFKAYFNARQQFNSNRDINIKSHYEVDLQMPTVELRLYDQSGTKITQTYELVNVSFTELTHNNGLGQDAAVMKMNIQMDYDAWINKLP